MANLTLRLVKGVPLTNAEVDANFTALNTDKLETTDLTADIVDFDNTSVDLLAASVQAAIEELTAKKVDVGDIRVGVTLFPTDTVFQAGSYLAVDSTTDTAFNDVPVDLSTGIVSSGFSVAQFYSEQGFANGEVLGVQVSLVGQLRKTAGNNNEFANFYFEVYHLDGQSAIETLLATSGRTIDINSANYEEYQASAFIAGPIEFDSQDRLKLVFYAGDVVGSPNYDIKLGGTDPLRFSMPIALANLATIPDASQVLVAAGSFTGVLSATDTDVQTALATIDQNAISDAPSDGSEYVRLNGAWAQSTGGSGVSLDFDVVNNGTGEYVFDGTGTISDANPKLYLTRGNTYTFKVNASGHPFWINTTNATGTAQQFNDGVTNNGADVGDVVFVVPMDAPESLHYNCQYHTSMNGEIVILDTPDLSPYLTEETDPAAFELMQYRRDFLEPGAFLYLQYQDGEYKMTGESLPFATTTTANYAPGVQYGGGTYISAPNPFTVMGGNLASYPLHIQIQNPTTATFSFRFEVGRVDPAGTVHSIFLTRNIFCNGLNTAIVALDASDPADTIYDLAQVWQTGDRLRILVFLENEEVTTQSFPWRHPDLYGLTANGLNNTLFQRPGKFPGTFDYSVGGLVDVDTSGAVAGDRLEYDGAEWSPVTPDAASPGVNGDVVYKTGGFHWMPISPKTETFFSNSVRNEFAHAIPIQDGNWEWDEFTVTGGAGVNDVVATIEFPRGAYVGDVGDLQMTVQVRLRHTGSVPIERIEVSYGKRSPEGSETGSNNQINSITSTTSEADYMASLPTNTGLLTLTEEDQLYVIVRIGADAGAWEAIISDSGNGNDILTAVPIGVYSGSKLFLGAQDVHIGGNDVRIHSHGYTYLDGETVNIGRDKSFYTYIDSQFRSEYKSGGSHQFEGTQLEFRAEGSVSERAYFQKAQQRDDTGALVDTVSLQFWNYTSQPNYVAVNRVYTTKVNFYNQFNGFQGDFVGTAASLYDADTLALQTDITSLQAQINALSANKIGDAPIDGKTYVRQNGEWVAADLGLDLLIYPFDGGLSDTVYFAETMDGGASDTLVFDDAISPVLGGVSNSTYEVSPLISGLANMSTLAGANFNVDGGRASTTLFSSNFDGGAA